MTAVQGRPGPCLLEHVQRLLERTYRMRSGIDEVGRFVIGDHGFSRLYHEHAGSQAGAGDGSGARVLVRDAPEGLRACIYYPDGLIHRLERFPPQRGIGEENVDAFAALVEELDHLLMLAERRRHGRSLTLFELELHANVSKHLVLTRFLAGATRRVEPDRRLWLRYHLFGKQRYCDADPQVRERYRDARRWAVRLLDALPGLTVTARLEVLRRFHDLGTQGKLELIGTMKPGVRS